jgi:LemA protein
MTALVIILSLIAFVVFTYFILYNSLLRSKVEVDNAWSQIDVQLKRRHDLIPNLVNTVKGYMQHEKDTLEKVIQARAAAVGAKDIPSRMKAEGEISGLLGRLLAVVEQYPNLKADRHAIELMEELKTTENSIAFARQHYNDIVMQYNYKIKAFPWIFVAPMMNLSKREYFEIENEEEKEAPEVKF